MEQLTIQSLGFLIVFQEDIKPPWHHRTTDNTVIRVSHRISTGCQNHHRRRHHQQQHHHHHHHRGLPGRSSRVRANLRVLPY